MFFIIISKQWTSMNYHMKKIFYLDNFRWRRDLNWFETMQFCKSTKIKAQISSSVDQPLFVSVLWWLPVIWKSRISEKFEKTSEKISIFFVFSAQNHEHKNARINKLSFVIFNKCFQLCRRKCWYPSQCRYDYQRCRLYL